MSNIHKTIEALKQAEQYLDKETSDPKKYNDPMSTALEILSWEIRSKISTLQENYYWMGN